MTKVARAWISKENFRRILAVAFLAFLLAEWGGHGLAFAHSGSVEGDGTFSQARETGHEDPCKTLIHCPDGGTQDQRVPGVSHDRSQQSIFFSYLPAALEFDELLVDSRPPWDKIKRRFLPLSPPFHPPEIS